MQEAADPRWERAGAEAWGMAYVRETIAEGRPVWELVNWAGVAINASTNRSSVFFYAADAGMKVVRPH